MFCICIPSYSPKQLLHISVTIKNTNDALTANFLSVPALCSIVPVRQGAAVRQGPPVGLRHLRDVLGRT